jgi:hypothetical protein
VKGRDKKGWVLVVPKVRKVDEERTITRRRGVSLSGSGDNPYNHYG